MKKRILIYLLAASFVLVYFLRGLNAQSKDSEDLFDQLYDYGAQLTEDYLPESIIEEYELPSYEDWKFFWGELAKALHSYSFEDLAWIRPEVEKALEFLQAVTATKPYADWLLQRLDYCDVAYSVIRSIPIEKVKAVMRAEQKTEKIISPKKPIQKIAVPPTINQQRTQAVQDPNLWKKEISKHPKIEQAPSLVEKLKKVFSAEGLPAEWVWIAEVESSMNPQAKSPMGAVGLFQLMPQTAARFGLKTRPVDDRLNPEKSAKAAARYLKILYRQFRSWPLALAAYNAGEGTIGRLLKKHNAKNFEDIAFDLPVETRMYVPKVLALVELREGKKAETLPAPKFAWEKPLRFSIYLVKWVLTGKTIPV